MTALILSFVERFPDLGIGDELVSGPEVTLLEVVGVPDRFVFVEVMVGNDTPLEVGVTGVVVFMG